uniref:Secreted protein n=1 Tax=Eutreptiella gymnastica TaxID=73025 RepID=A0A7S4CLW2_9EUGL
MCFRLMGMCSCIGCSSWGGQLLPSSLLLLDMLVQGAALDPVHARCGNYSAATLGSHWFQGFRAGIGIDKPYHDCSFRGGAPFVCVVPVGGALSMHGKNAGVSQ